MKRIIIVSVVSAWIVITGMLWDVMNEQNFSFQVKQRSSVVKASLDEINDASTLN
jgi:hypothetical protein